MKTKFSKLKRISIELDMEIEKMAEMNNLKYTDATREIAMMLKNKRNRKIIYEIKF